MTLEERFSGVFTALITPFAGGEVDFEAYEALVRDQLAAGVAGLVPVGTTGEAATLSKAETAEIIRRTVALADGRAFVLAGTGSNSTEKAVEMTGLAEECGADGCLVVTPYYNKPSQAGLIEHYAAVAGATRLPIMLYSVPGRCGVEIAPDTAARIARKFFNVIGIKEAGGRSERVTELRLACGHDFIIHSGDDALTLPFLALGAVGVTSVVANYAPVEMVALLEAWRHGDRAKALRLHDRLFDLAKAMFTVGNPVPIKTALHIQGRIECAFRKPLVPMTVKQRRSLESSLEKFSQPMTTAGNGLQKNRYQT
ncbi:MAG: 4-hydroxy-tetrahydrodipicolinate synthase [Rhodospirillales bacterium]|nr:4-hydroxy-tetrahydrodipicolinate synthase [Rhodospirillales bacterium]